MRLFTNGSGSNDATLTCLTEDAGEAGRADALRPSGLRVDDALSAVLTLDALGEGARAWIRERTGVMNTCLITCLEPGKEPGS